MIGRIVVRKKECAGKMEPGSSWRSSRVFCHKETFLSTSFTGREKG